MITKPIDVLQRFPIRKSKAQKAAFRDEVTQYAQAQGYAVNVEKGSFGAQNIVIGNPGTAKYLITAHYDTPASIGIPNFLTPCNPVTYLVYQILLVGAFLGVAFLAGSLANMVTDNQRLIFLAGYVVYMGLLLLMLFGPANRHNANDNTSGVVSVLQIASSLPEAARENVAFVLFDLEEAGLIGSSAYRKAHKDQTEQQIVLNLDCVGDGDHIVFFPVKKAKKNEMLLQKLRSVCGEKDGKTLSLRDRGFAAGSSDHKNFPNGVGTMAFHKAKVIGLYCDRIHTWRDKILDESNVTFITEAILTLICDEKEN